MEKTSKELLKEFVNSQQFTSTTDIMNSMKELFSDVLQQVTSACLPASVQSALRAWILKVASVFSYCMRVLDRKSPLQRLKELQQRA